MFERLKRVVNLNIFNAGKIKVEDTVKLPRPLPEFPSINPKEDGYRKPVQPKDPQEEI